MSHNSTARIFSKFFCLFCNGMFILSLCLIKKCAAILFELKCELTTWNITKGKSKPVPSLNEQESIRKTGFKTWFSWQSLLTEICRFSMKEMKLFSKSLWFGFVLKSMPFPQPTESKKESNSENKDIFFFMSVFEIFLTVSNRKSAEQSKLQKRVTETLRYEKLLHKG